ncbi:hypothetical protein M885DRAFT_561143 [Pelagophyceae sp. CCMP2097]|nr:hypothetical protein M885DRAFT_561143 [Pelagophyceae sp. CCMP2097]
MPPKVAPGPPTAGGAPKADGASKAAPAGMPKKKSTAAVKPAAAAAKPAAAVKPAAAKPAAKGAKTKKVAPAPPAAAPPAAEPAAPAAAAPAPAPVADAPAPALDLSHLSPLDRARALWAEPPPAGVAYTRVVVHYSSYKNAFECRDGVARWQDVDVEYCISFVFKGEFAKRIRAFPKGATTHSAESPAVAESMGVLGSGAEGRDAALDELYFHGLDANFEGRYVLEVKEDEAAGLGVETRTGPIQFASRAGEGDSGIGGAPRKEGCSCLYGNPCADKYVCDAWDKRFEVAKKNGWKG